MEPIRVCKNCGVEAYTLEDLEIFVKNKQCKHDRAPECKKCRNKRNIENRGNERPLKSRHVFLDGVESKRCTKCNIVLQLNMFYPNKHSWDGFMFRCKTCEKVYQRGWATKNPDKVKVIHARYKSKHPDRYREIQESSLNRRMTFNEKLLRFPEEFRINICEYCGKSYPNELSERTHLHHTKYDEEDPLEYTVELCRSCHITEHHKLRRMKTK